jgi:SAM-dependent methyltransferase
VTLTEAQGIVECYTRNPYYAAAYKAMESEYLPHVCRVLEGLEPCRVLDVGPGYGTMAVWLESLGHEVTVMDRVPLGVHMAQDTCAHAGLRYEEVDVEDAALPEQFDRVLLTQVLPHLTWRPDEALMNIAVMLAPGGEALIATVNGDGWQGDPPYYGTDWRAIPRHGDGAPEATSIVKCLYNPETFRDLLDSVFPSVTLWQPHGCSTMFAICSNGGDDGSE